MTSTSWKKIRSPGAAQTDGHRVADEMNLVAARGELDAQLGGHHARTAVCRVACDSDFHDAPRGLCLPETPAGGLLCLLAPDWP